MKIQTLLALTLLWISGSAYAIPSYDYNASGDITGVSELEIDGVLWDMTLHDVSFADLIGTAGITAVYTSAFSLAATDELVAFTNTQTDNHGSFSGCVINSQYSCYLLTAFNYDTIVNRVTGYAAKVDDFIVDATVTFAGIPDNINYGNITYATWEQTAASVPEPHVALLIASGLIGVVGFSRRKKA